MTTFRAFIVILIMLYMPVKQVFGQFIDLELNLETQVEATVEQSMHFGQTIIGSGLQSIPMGSPNMGVFQIRALRNQTLLISVEFDDELVHQNPQIDARIPLTLFATYTSRGINDYRNSVAFDSNLETVIVSSPENNPDAQWSSIFIYVFGDINVGNVPLGVYTGEVILSIIYE